MSNKQIAALMAVRAFAGTNTVSADNDFADGVAAANRHVINHIDYLITQVQAGHEVPFVVEHESRFPFQGKVTSEPQPTDRHALQAEGRHPAPCARFCEANAFQIEIRQLSAQLEQADRQRVQDGCAFLCYAWGESDRPCAAIVSSHSEVRQFLIDEWLGEEGDELDDAMARFDADPDDGNAWDGSDSIEWKFEIGGIRITKICDCTPRAMLAAAPEAPAQGEQAAEPVRDEREPSPTAGMTLGQRILHVGGRTNAAGYVEFGSVQAVDALVRHVLRDLPDAAPAQASAVDEREPLTDEQLDRMNPYRQSKSARAIWASGFRASERHQMTCTAWRDRGALAQTGGAA